VRDTHTIVSAGGNADFGHHFLIQMTKYRGCGYSISIYQFEVDKYLAAFHSTG